MYNIERGKQEDLTTLMIKSHMKTMKQKLFKTLAIFSPSEDPTTYEEAV